MRANTARFREYQLAAFLHLLGQGDLYNFTPLETRSEGRDVGPFGGPKIG